MESNPLIGAWRLVAYEGHTGDDVLYPLGEDATGYIMYTADGYMSVAMMAAGRTNFAGGDMFAGTDEEKIAAAGLVRVLLRQSTNTWVTGSYTR